MNIQLTPGQWFVLAVLWFSFGMILDVIKIIVAAIGNTGSKAPQTLKNISHWGKVEIIKVDPTEMQLKFLKDLAKSLGLIKCSLLSWSTNFLRQVVEPESPNDVDIVTVGSTQPNNVAIIPVNSTKPEYLNQDDESYLVSCDNDVTYIFNKQPENKYAGQQIIGALLGFLTLVAFLYADAAQGAQTFSLLFEGGIPPFLNSIIMPLVMASAGTAVILGLFIGDILGMTHLGLFKSDAPKPFLYLIIANLIVSLLLSTIIALVRMQLLGTDNPVIDTFVNIAQSIIILPMLVTTFLLFRGISGAYVFLSILLSIFAVPFGIFEFFLRVLADLLRLGIIGGSFLITRITWLVLGALEMLFWLLELTIKGAFAVLTYIFAGTFFIPFLIFKIILKVFNQEEFYKTFLANLTSTTLQPHENVILTSDEPPVILIPNELPTDSSEKKI